MPFRYGRGCFRPPYGSHVKPGVCPSGPILSLAEVPPVFGDTKATKQIAHYDTPSSFVFFTPDSWAILLRKNFKILQNPSLML